MASVILRSAATSMGLRGLEIAEICTMGLPRRVMHTGSPAAACSTNSLSCALALARLTLFIFESPDYLTGHLGIMSVEIKQCPLTGRWCDKVSRADNVFKEVPRPS